MINEENLKNKIIEFLDNDCEYFLTKEKDDCYICNYEKSYDDYIGEEDVKKILEGKTIEERYDNYCMIIENFCFKYEDEEINYITNEFCNKYNYEQDATEVQDILVNLISFNYDTYLREKYDVNIIIDFNSQDSDSEFSNSSNLENCKNNNLYSLLKKQGYTKKDYEKNCKFLKDNKSKIKKDKYNYDYNKIKKLGGSEFLTSVKEEIDNNGYDYLTTLVVLKKMTLKDLIELNKIEVNTKNTIGLFNECYGAGSLLELKLEKDFILDRDKDIYKIQVEGARSGFGYTVNETYGLDSSCWSE